MALCNRILDICPIGRRGVIVAISSVPALESNSGFQAAVLLLRSRIIQAAIFTIEAATTAGNQANEPTLKVSLGLYNIS